MLKSIPKSKISKRSFPVYKSWTVTNSDYPIISASLESGLFDTDVSNRQGSVYTHPLYRSIQSKFYNQNANPFTLHGRVKNIANLDSERNISGSIYVISLPQDKFGEEIKPNTIQLLDTDNSVNYTDDGYGSIVSDTPLYTLVLIDLQTNDIIIRDNDGEEFSGTITNFDIQTGLCFLTFNGDSDTVTVVKIDLESSDIQFSQPLDFDGLLIDERRYGNVFYDDGLVVLNKINPFVNYSFEYKSTQTIYENEILISAKAGEFNYSQNPTAVQVTLNNSYEFETTAITNGEPAGTRKIKEILDIERKENFYGTYGSSTGSWDDYFNYQLSDPTGSYLTTYVTTIGLYDESGDMVAIAKLPTPIKNLPDYDLNFIVRFDT